MKREIAAIRSDRIDDFINVFKVFRGAPYYEDWTDDLLVEEYNDLVSTGFVYGYYIDNKCVGLITFRPMRSTDHHPIYYEHPEKVAYFSDFAVLNEYQNQGIGTELIRYMLKILKEKGFERVYMKTLQVGKSMSYGIAIKHGFKLLEGVTSVDKMPRTVAGVPEEDIKIYLEKEL